MLLSDVSVSPVDAYEWQNTRYCALWDVFLKVNFPFQRLEDDVLEPNAELRALATGKVRETENEAESFDGKCLDAVFNDDALSNHIDVGTEEYPAAVEADGVNVNETSTAGEVCLEAVTVTARDKDGSIGCFFLESVTSDFLEEPSLDESFGQYKIGMVFHGSSSSGC